MEAGSVPIILDRGGTLGELVIRCVGTNNTNLYSWLIFEHNCNITFYYL